MVVSIQNMSNGIFSFLVTEWNQRIMLKGYEVIQANLKNRYIFKNTSQMILIWVYKWYAWLLYFIAP